MVDSATLVGTWRRTPGADRSLPYPDQLVFLDSGVYRAPLREDGPQLWQSGDWELTDRGIRLQCANDAMREYPVSVAADGTLTIVDEAGREVTYRRE